METKIRSRCIFSGQEDLEELHTFEHFPIFMGCTDGPASEDQFEDMVWMIGRSSGCVQLGRLIPLPVLYKSAHNDAIGGTWNTHHDAFATFVASHARHEVLELGGANGLLAGKALDHAGHLAWTVLDPNPRIPEGLPVRVIQSFFGGGHPLDGAWDTVVHSHTFEHAYQPLDFLAAIRAQLPQGGRHIFSLPNMKVLLEKGYTNCLNFEHTAFLREEYIEWALAQRGFTVLDKKYFLDHSIFYATEATDLAANEPLPGLYGENKAIFERFISLNLEKVRRINAAVRDLDGPFYIFGAHIFTQFLIAFGLDITRAVGVLDNSPAKQGKRLYGTRFTVVSPAALRDAKTPTVVLCVANYADEIKDGIIQNHNPKTIFVEASV